jgi:hypothetical protein
MSTEEIKKTYGLSSDQAYKARMKGFFVKNYMKKQIVIDRENFNSAVCTESILAPGPNSPEATSGPRIL